MQGQRSDKDDIR